MTCHCRKTSVTNNINYGSVTIYICDFHTKILCQNFLLLLRDMSWWHTVARLFLHTVTFLWESLQSFSFTPPTLDSWWSRRWLSFWPIKLTHICQLPMHHFQSILHQQVMNGPASFVQYDAGCPASRHLTWILRAKQLQMSTIW